MDFTDLFRSLLLGPPKITHAAYAERAGVTAAFVSLVATRKSKVPKDRIEAWADAFSLQGEVRSRFLELAYLEHSQEHTRGSLAMLADKEAKGREEIARLRSQLRAIIKVARKAGVDLPDRLGDV